jgi:hypothetical protein
VIVRVGSAASTRTTAPARLASSSASKTFKAGLHCFALQHGYANGVPEGRRGSVAGGRESWIVGLRALTGAGRGRWRKALAGAGRSLDRGWRVAHIGGCLSA